MSWERNSHDYKYESIQHGYSVIEDYDENEVDPIEVSLEQMLELENEELEIEEVF